LIVGGHEMKRFLLGMGLMVCFFVQSSHARRIVQTAEKAFFDFKVRQIGVLNLAFLHMFGPSEMCWRTRQKIKYDGDLIVAAALPEESEFVSNLLYGDGLESEEELS